MITTSIDRQFVIRKVTSSEIAKPLDHFQHFAAIELVGRERENAKFSVAKDGEWNRPFQIVATQIEDIQH